MVIEEHPYVFYTGLAVSERPTRRHVALLTRSFFICNPESFFSFIFSCFHFKNVEGFGIDFRHKDGCSGPECWFGLR